MSYICLIDPKQKFCYVPIIKNARGKIETLLVEHGWQFIDYATIDESSVLSSKLIHLVVLRDPFERVLSQLHSVFESSLSKEKFLAIYEAGYLADFTNLFLFCFLKKPNLSLQSEFNKLYPYRNQIKYFWLNPNFGYQFNKYLQSENEFIPFNNLVINETNKNSKSYQFFEEYFFDYKNIHQKTKLLEYFQVDYDLINDTEFFVRR